MLGRRHQRVGRGEAGEGRKGRQHPEQRPGGRRHPGEIRPSHHRRRAVHVEAREAQAGAGRPVSQGDLQVGDIISFYGGGHSGIYVGNGNVVHASTEGSPVSIASVASMPYNGARRI